MNHPISDLLNVSMKCINEMIDANTIIGTPITHNNSTIIPVSKVQLGFVSGGSDIKPNTNKADPLFGGGTGGGVSLTPIAFLVITAENINLISLNNDARLKEKILDFIPGAFEKLKVLIKNNTENDC